MDLSKPLSLATALPNHGYLRTSQSPVQSHRL